MSPAIGPSDPQILYAGINSSGVYKSTNGGVDWVSSGLTNSTVPCLTFDPSGILYAGTESNVVFRLAP